MPGWIEFFFLLEQSLSKTENVLPFRKLQCEKWIHELFKGVYWSVESIGQNNVNISEINVYNSRVFDMTPSNKRLRFKIFVFWKDVA